jgi:hypothetical protein
MPDETVKGQAPSKTSEAGDPKPAAKLVATTVHLPADTLDLLRDVALVRHISDVGALARHQKASSKSRPSISDVITSLVEANRPLLERELEATLGPSRGVPKQK